MSDSKEPPIRLSVIVPAYNEETGLKVNIKKYLAYLEAQAFSFEIIIVNDGSSDKTLAIAHDLSLEYSKIKIVSFESNRGKGAAIRAGFLKGRGEFLLFLDADNASAIDHLEKAWPLFEKGYDLVIGSRNSKDAPQSEQVKPQILVKRLAGTLGNSLIRLLAIKNIHDTQCGFKIFTKKSLNIILPKTKINRWAVDVEYLLIAERHNLKIGIIPIKWNCGPISRVGFFGYFITLKEIFLIKLNMLRGLYD